MDVLPLPKKKYYHATLNPLAMDVLQCGDFYESIDNDCPEPIFAGGYYIGFPHSKIPELSFSKSIEASIISQLVLCEKDEKCEVTVYETEEEPEIDISDCFFADFELLEEVRFRRDVPIKNTLSLEVPSKLVKQAIKMYDECTDDEHGYPINECLNVDGERLKRLLGSLIAREFPEMVDELKTKPIKRPPKKKKHSRSIESFLENVL